MAMCIQLDAKPLRFTAIEIHDKPILRTKNATLDNGDVVSMSPEILLIFHPEEIKPDAFCGRLEVSVILHAEVDQMNISSRIEPIIVQVILWQQSMDAETLLLHNFGKFLSALNTHDFETTDQIIELVLDQWNDAWEKSKQQWEPYYQGMTTGNFPQLNNVDLAAFRKEHFGDDSTDHDKDLFLCYSETGRVELSTEFLTSKQPFEYTPPLYSEIQKF